MIHKPSAVACRPLGREPGDLNAISTGPVLRAGTAAKAGAPLAARAVVSTLAPRGIAPANPRNARRLTIVFAPSRAARRARVAASSPDCAGYTTAAAAVFMRGGWASEPPSSRCLGVIAGG